MYKKLFLQMRKLKYRVDENSCCSKQFGLSVTAVHSVMTVITAPILTAYVPGPHLGSARGLPFTLSLHILTEISRARCAPHHASCVLYSAAIVCAL